jgi:hypothetical protein
MLLPTLMDGLVLELVDSSLPAYSALVVSQDWLTVPVVQQLGAITRVMLDLPVLQVSLHLVLLQILFPTIDFISLISYVCIKKKLE